MNLQEIDLNELEFEEVGIWPLPVRIGALVIIFILSLILAYYIILRDPLDFLTRQRNEEFALRKQFAEKHHQAANLNAYKKQMLEMQTTFRQLLRQLPAEGHVPELLEDVSLKAANAGLEFKLIKPGVEKDQGFYIELPIELSVVGTYHGFGEFISGVLGLPRIITLHDFTIKKVTSNKDGEVKSILTMNVEAKTYWYTKQEQS
jgi:type IV pilus assembly protein PilO